MSKSNAIMNNEQPMIEGANVSIEGNLVKVTGKGGKLERTFSHPQLSISLKGKSVVVSSKGASKKEVALMGTWTSHINNMMRGVTEGFTYKMKIVYAHFPMKAMVKGEEFVIENFVGEKHPRITRIVGETKVQVKGDIVELVGPNKEDVGQTAANIELLTRIKHHDPRVFQDGIYITMKAK